MGTDRFSMNGKRRVALAAAASLVLVSLAAGARAAGVAERPQIEVEQAELDLGTREPGPKLEFVFRLKNTGSVPLEITDAKPKCGCVVAGYDRVIPPGGSGTVTAVLDTANRHGPLVKHLTVFSNDPDNSALPLTLKVALRHPVELSPADLTFELQPGKGEEQIVTLQSFEPGPLKIVKIESSSPFVQAALVPAEAGAEGEGANGDARYRVRISVLPSAPTAAFDATVTIQTDSPKRPRVAVEVKGIPAGAVAAFPSRLYFDEVAAHPEAPVVRPITLLKRGGPFKLLSARTSDPALQLQVISDPAGRFCEVAVRYAGGWKPGSVKGLIVLQTSDPARPQIEIPYAAEVGP